MENYEIVFVMVAVIVFICLCVLAWMDRHSDRLNYRFSRHRRRAPAWLREIHRNGESGRRDDDEGKP
jgi:amino acid transporter